MHETDPCATCGRDAPKWSLDADGRCLACWARAYRIPWCVRRPGRVATGFKVLRFDRRASGETS